MTLFPVEVWTWSDDAMTRQFLRQDLRTKAGLGVKGCPVGPPVAARDYPKPDAGTAQAPPKETARKRRSVL